MTIIGVSVVFLLIIGLFPLFGWYLSAPTYKGEVTDHFDGDKFFNPEGARAKGFEALIKWGLSRKKGSWERNNDIPFGPKPAAQVDLGITATFVNHSTYLLQVNGLNILTDPVWSERCGPFGFLGPRRMRPPGIGFEDLPNIDIVLLTHNHYDHLDLSTVLKLKSKYDPVFIVPLGVDLFLAKKGIKKIKSLDWWEAVSVGIEIKAVPAQHFSSRGIFDRDKTLWCGYVLTALEKKIYYAGDSGYGLFFKEIGKKEGPFDLSMIPIGAFEPEWFMSPIHISPSEAVRVHKDVKSKQTLAMHFGTFALADEGQGAAEEQLLLALQDAGVDQQAFLIPLEGEPFHLAD